MLILVFGLEQQNYAMMMIMYGIRGLAYPMFIYSFVVWITYSSPSYKLASKNGLVLGNVFNRY